MDPDHRRDVNAYILPLPFRRGAVPTTLYGCDISFDVRPQESRYPTTLVRRVGSARSGRATFNREDVSQDVSPSGRRDDDRLRLQRARPQPRRRAMTAALCATLRLQTSAGSFSLRAFLRAHSLRRLARCYVPSRAASRRTASFSVLTAP